MSTTWFPLFWVVRRVPGGASLRVGVKDRPEADRVAAGGP